MRDLFASDPLRFDKFSVRWLDFLFDFSKNRLTEETLALLLQLAREAGLERASWEINSFDQMGWSWASNWQRSCCPSWRGRRRPHLTTRRRTG